MRGPEGAPVQQCTGATRQVIYERVAAVDVAKASGVVCMRGPDPARPGRFVNRIWDNVGATRAQISELGRELLRCQVQMVTLESTSDYWRIWYYALEAIGLTVQLVSASQAKNLKGRPKTDPLTELPDVFAAQAGCPSRRPITEMSTMPESPGCFGLAASPIGTETGHTGLNQSPAFSSLPIFDVSRSRP